MSPWSLTGYAYGTGLNADCLCEKTCSELSSEAQRQLMRIGAF